MTKNILANRKQGESVVHITLAAPGADTITVAGASSDLDNDSGAMGNEDVISASISKIKYGVGGNAAGFWRITRNSVTVAVLSGTGEIGFDCDGMALTQDNTSDIVCNLVGTGTEGFLTFELQKVSTVATDQYLVG